jgi:hypothetical protein
MVEHLEAAARGIVGEGAAGFNQAQHHLVSRSAAAAAATKRVISWMS